jgi:hypothetical protein
MTEQSEIDLLAEKMMSKMVGYMQFYVPIADRNFNDEEAAQFLRISTRYFRNSMINSKDFPTPFLLPFGTRHAERRRWRASDLIRYRDSLLENNLAK